jgi:hypothetical protein
MSKYSAAIFESDLRLHRSVGAVADLYVGLRIGCEFCAWASVASIVRLARRCPQGTTEEAGVIKIKLVVDLQRWWTVRRMSRHAVVCVHAPQDNTIGRLGVHVDFYGRIRVSIALIDRVGVCGIGELRPPIVDVSL